MTTERISWEQSGKAIIIDITADGFTAFVDGKQQNGSRIMPPSPLQKALFVSRGVVGTIGSLVIYRERAQELEAIRTKLEAQKPVDPLDELRHLESVLFVAMETANSQQDRDDNIAEVYVEEQRARQAFDAWCNTHRDLYETEMARRKTAQQERVKGVNMWM